MQPLSVFEVRGIGPCPHVIVFHFGWRFETFAFNFGYRLHGIRVDGRQKEKETFESSKETDTCGRGVCSKRKKRVLFSC